MGIFDFFKKKPEVTCSGHINNKCEVVSPSGMAPESEIISVEKHITGKKPTCDGLYPHEVLVLSYAPRYCDHGNEYPRFWKYTYGVDDVTGILEDLQRRGFIKQGNISDAINLEKLSVIKGELKKSRLRTTGTKEELITRLIENVSNKELSSIFPRIPFSLTDAGKKILVKYEWIPYIHAHSIDGLNIWNLTEMVQTPPYVKFRDKIWGHFNAMSLKYAQEGNWGLYRNIRFQMSEFVKEESRIERALHLLCEVIAYDLSGLTNGFDMRYLYIYAKGFFPYENSSVKLAPGIIKRVKEYAEILGLSTEQLHGLIVSEMKISISPIQLFMPEECGDIVLYEIENDIAGLEKLYSMAEQRFRRKYDKELKINDT